MERVRMGKVRKRRKVRGRRRSGRVSRKRGIKTDKFYKHILF